jgi:hypothetical protein
MTLRRRDHGAWTILGSSGFTRTAIDSSPPAGFPPPIRGPGKSPIKAPTSAPLSWAVSTSRPCEAVPALVAIEERPCLHGVLFSRTLQSRNNVAILRLNSWFRFGPRFSPHRAGYILEALNFSNPTERKCLPLFCRGFRNDFRDRRSLVSASRSPHAFATACAPERHLVLQGKINAQPARQVVVGSRSKGPISSGFYRFRTPAS